MMIYVFQDTNWDEFLADAQSMNYSFYLISGAFVILSHFFRALRWKQLISASGKTPSTANAFASVLFMYVSNLILPRSGEVARCGSIYKYEKIPIPLLLGTVVVERLVDLLSLLILTGLLIVLQFDLLQSIYFKSPLVDAVGSLFENKTTLLLILLLAIFAIILVYKKRAIIFKKGPLKKIGELLGELKNSFIQLLHLKNKHLFILYSIAIWVCYILMFYIPFYAYKPTKNLGIIVGITAFVAGSFGMIAPVQGGVGVWQFMVRLALVAMGVKSAHATTWSGVTFILMTLITAVAGTIGFIALPFINNKEEKSS